MNKRLSRLLVVLFVWLCAAGHTAAGVIYSNFGPGMTFDTNPFDGWTINGFFSPSIGQQAIAQKFTPAATNTFMSARVALSLFSGPGNVAVFLQADSNGLPGLVLEQINVSGLTAVPTIFTATSVVRPQLSGGTSYWLTVVAGGPGVLAGWSWNSIDDNDTGINFVGTQGGNPAGPWGSNPSPNLPRGAFQIDGIQTIPVKIDFKPGSNPNCVNSRSNGKSTVAIYGASTFNVVDVNQVSLKFGGAPALMCKIEDGQMEEPTLIFNTDGIPDLVCHFDTAQVAWPPAESNCGLVKLTGALNNGTPIEGSDTACRVGESTCNSSMPIPVLQ